MRRHVSALLVVVAAMVVLLGQISIAADNPASTGKEVYECNCGKGCKCGTVANQPGKCVCGIDMKKVN